MARTDIRVQTQDFSVEAEMLAVRRRSPDMGAIVNFVGVVRDVNEGDSVSALALEHYPGMTEKSLAAIVEKARARWDIGDVTVIHRVGPLNVGDQIVLTLVASRHRHAAFEACAFIMDWLKTEAPFWKKETTPTGDRWVEARESDEYAKARWGE